MYYDRDHSWPLTTASRVTALPTAFVPPWPDLHLAIDSGSADCGYVSDIIVTAASAEALAAKLGALLAGERVTVDLPLVGEREADIIWVAGNRAGVRMVAPVDEEELRDTICGCDAIATYFPGLRGYRSPSRWCHA